MICFAVRTLSAILIAFRIRAAARCYRCCSIRKFLEDE